MPLTPSKRIAGLAASAVSSILTRAANAGWSDVIPMAGGEPRFPVPASALSALQMMPSDMLTKYSPFRGYPELLRLICGKLASVNDMVVEPENVCCVPGGSSALAAAISALSDPGDEVLIPDPCWEHYPSIVRLCGATPKRFALDLIDGEYRWNWDALRAAIGPATRAVLLNTPLNPTGTILSEQDARAVVAMCDELDLWLIVDEEYEAFSYARPHVSAGRFGSNVVTLQSFSKSHALTGIRLGYVVGPREVVELVQRYGLYTYMYPPSPSQCIAIGLLQGDYPRQMQVAGREYQAKMERLYTALSGVPGIEVTRSEGGPYLFPRLPGWNSRDAVEELVSKHHVLCVPGENAGTTSQDRIRLFVGLDDALLDEGARRIRAMVARS